VLLSFLRIVFIFFFFIIDVFFYDKVGGGEKKKEVKMFVPVGTKATVLGCPDAAG
jgi:hypothetical protein